MGSKIDRNYNFEKYIKEVNNNDLMKQIPSEGGLFNNLSKILRYVLNLNFKFKTEDKASVTVQQLDRTYHEISQKQRVLSENIEEYKAMREQVAATQENLSSLNLNIRGLEDQINAASQKLKALKEGKKKDPRVDIKPFESNLRNMIKEANNFLELYRSKDFSKKGIDSRIQTLFFQQVTQQVDELENPDPLRQELAEVKSLGNRLNPDRIKNLQDHVTAAIGKEKQERFERALERLKGLGIDNPGSIIERSDVETILQNAMKEPSDERQGLIDWAIITSSDVIKKFKDHYVTAEVQNKVEREIQEKVSKKNALNEGIEELLRLKFKSGVQDLNRNHRTLLGLLDAVAKFNELPSFYEKMRGFVEVEFKGKLSQFENDLRQDGHPDPKKLAQEVVFGENTSLNDEVLSRYLTDLKDLPVRQWKEKLNIPKAPTLSAPVESLRSDKETDPALVRQVLSELDDYFPSREIHTEPLNPIPYALFSRLTELEFQQKGSLEALVAELEKLKKYKNVEELSKATESKLTDAELEEFKQYLEEKAELKIAELHKKLDELSEEQVISFEQEIARFEEGIWKEEAIRDFFNEKINKCRQALERSSNSVDKELIETQIKRPLDEIEKSLELNNLEPAVLDKSLSKINSLLVLSKNPDYLNIGNERAYFLDRMKWYIKVLSLEDTPFNEEISKLNPSTLPEISSDLEKEYLEKTKKAFESNFSEKWKKEQELIEDKAKMAVMQLIEDTWLEKDSTIEEHLDSGRQFRTILLDKSDVQRIRNATEFEELIDLKKELDGKMRGVPHHSLDVEKKMKNIENFIQGYFKGSFITVSGKLPEQALNRLKVRYEQQDPPKPDKAKFEAFRRNLNNKLQDIKSRRTRDFEKDFKTTSSTNLKEIVDAYQLLLNSIQKDIEFQTTEAYEDWLEVMRAQTGAKGQ